MTGRTFKPLLGVVALGAAMTLAACSSGTTAAPTSSGGSSGAPSNIVIGISNTVEGNGWRETMICSIKAQALASGDVSKVISISKNGDPSSQIQDMQNLISQGVNMIIVDPSDPQKLNQVIQEATSRGITVIAVDSSVTEPTAYVVSNDQTKYGALGMQWLADKLGGKGNILYMRGTQGVSADTDRDNGVQSVLQNYPGITVKTVWTNWDYTTAAQIATQEFTASNYDGVWTTGPDSSVVTAIQATGKPLVPVIGADNNGFIQDLISGDPGALVTNPAAVGGAAVTVGLNVMSGDKPDRTTLLTPQIFDATNNLSDLQSLYDPNLGALDNPTVSVPGYTTYTKDQLRACKGPGE